MDYAKLALLKAEELERKGKAVASGGISRIGLIFEKMLAAGQEFKLCSVMGSGEAGVIVSLAIAGGTEDFGDGSENNQSNKGSLSGDIDFIIGGKKVFSRPLSSTPLFMASLNLSGEVDICIKPHSQITVVSAEVMIIGGQVVNSAAYGVRVAKVNDITAAVYLNDGEVRVSVSDMGKVADMAKYTSVGFGTEAAITGISTEGEECFAVCHIDAQKNVFLSVVGLSGAVISCQMLEISADSLALISLNANQLALGYCYKGYAYATVLSYPDITFSYTIKLEEATSIEFVRKSYPPAVILGKKSGNVIRMAQDELSNDEAVAICVECYF